MCAFVQVEAAKKTYHMACKEEKVASMREANIRSEASVTAEQQKKIHEKVDKCKQDSQKVRVPGVRRSHGPYGNVGVQKDPRHKNIERNSSREQVCFLGNASN